MMLITPWLENGVSMVTLCYLRRFFNFLTTLINNTNVEKVLVSEELNEFFNAVTNVLDKHKNQLEGRFGGDDKRSLIDGLGEAGSDYRDRIYRSSFSGNKSELNLKDIQGFVDTTLSYLDHTIDANLRPDGMYHAYNLMKLSDNGDVEVSYLSEMLEGQVAALSSSYLSSEQSLKVLDGMKNSKLFRPDQYSYLLYPNKELPGFLERNDIDPALVESSDLLKQLIQDGDTSLILRDINGEYHFNGNFNNAGSVKEALGHLEKNGYAELVKQERKLVLDIFEKVFNHIAFTGRSGTFYGYEGLGSIYWHMVSKLLLAVQECCLKAIKEEASPEIAGRLLEHYYEIYEGIGVHKSPELYGAFPTDPYSHTPFGKGAQQPGMTGQVKEDILSRIGELGIYVKEGRLHFYPTLLKSDEFLTESRSMIYTDVNQNLRAFEVDENCLAFTHCQIPVAYQISEDRGIEVKFSDGSTTQFDGIALDTDLSTKIFKRTAELESIRV